MKNIALVGVILLLIAIKNFNPPSSERGPASIDPFAEWKQPDNSYNFYYSYQGKNLTITETSLSGVAAFESASSKCFKFFIKENPNFQKDQGLDIIDICSNPKKR